MLHAVVVNGYNGAVVEHARWLNNEVKMIPEFTYLGDNVSACVGCDPTDLGGEGLLNTVSNYVGKCFL